MMHRYIFTFFLAAFLLLTGNPARCEEKPPARVVVFSIPGVTWQDLLDNPDLFIRKLIDRGAIANINIRVQGGSYPINGYLSFGSGNRMNPAGEAGTFFNAGERIAGRSAAAIYLDNSDILVSSENIVMPGYKLLLDANRSLGYDAMPGALGTVLRKNNFKTAVLGNADVSSYRNFIEQRDFAAMAMDENGIIDLGDVTDGLLSGKPHNRYGLFADNAVMFEKFKMYYALADFLAVDLGDLHRVGSYHDPATGDHDPGDFNAALLKTDDFIKSCFYAMDTDRTVIILVSAVPSFNDFEYLMPIIVVGPGFEPGSLLTSPSTHRRGIVTNADALPTILNIFGLKTDVPTTGNTMHSARKDKRDMRRLAFMSNRAYNIDRNLRVIGINGFVIAQVFVFLITVFFLHYTQRMKKISARTGMLLALVILNFPLATYIANSIVRTEINAAPFFGIMIAISIAISIAGLVLPMTGLKKIALFSFIAALYISVDVMTGANSIFNSIFGYSPMIGGRYYGIGNESMALAEVAGCVSLAVMAGFINNVRFRILFFLAGALVITTVIGFPLLGANTGGIITVVCAFMVILLKLSGKKIGLKQLLMVALAVAVMLTVYIGIDSLSGAENKTHLGRAFAQVRDGGFRQVQLIAGRKLAMNFKVMVKFSSYMLIWLLTAITVYGWPNEIQKMYTKVFRDNPFLYIGFQGAFAGSLVGMCLNDSGVVIPCIIVSYLITCLNFLCLEEKLKEVS